MKILNVTLLILCAIILGLCIFVPKRKYNVEIYEKHPDGTITKFNSYVIDDTTGIAKRFPNSTYEIIIK